MALNKTTGNMYNFISHTWNTVKGKCPHECSYCYMKRWKNQREIRFDEKELKTDLGKGNFIFVGSSNDLFADAIPEEWIEKTLDHCIDFDKNKYFFQSKNPLRFKKLMYLIPPKSIFCTTLESNKWYPDIMRNTLKPKERAGFVALLLREYFEIHITIEPILKFDLDEFALILKQINPTQINIGADSGHNKLPEPSSEEIKSLIDELHNLNIKVVLKKNLKRLYNPTI